ncbi:D-glycero-beta-D-manno-heptose 1-phosphate adenylyltransferase [Nocardia pneumoniae]|uniref:D-glycero-beta-D-manno-heptose 1-phosphate adenylyltransferase n=1 Tax=Nocardia pneumoniae TaxID=228601 RepID=UPI000317E64B|nr:D-glycero-beta-D-manno-heptose 1-phosphate adenylyltransferase [Nocardia pneumoniae]
MDPEDIASTAKADSGLGPDAADRIGQARPSIVVLGDAVLDVWKWGRCERLCREAPVPVIDIERSSTMPGAAGNTAVNLAALGARTRLVALTGDDWAAAALRDALERSNVDAAGLRHAAGRATAVETRIVADDHVMVCYDEGGGTPGDDSEVDALVASLDAALTGATAVVIGDCLGALGDRMCHALTARRERFPLLIVDTHHPGRWRSLRPDLVRLDADDAIAVLGLSRVDGDRPPTKPEQRVDVFDRHRHRLFETVGTSTIVITLDRDGSVLLDEDRPVHRTWAQPVPDSRSAGGAGAYLAAMTLASLSMPLTSAVELAQAAADVGVHRPGTAVRTTGRLRERLARSGGAVLPQRELAEVVRTHRADGKRIVFTNGCFDVLHAGHVAYLNEAKRLGDILVVAVNSDAGVRKLKGPDRPVNAAADRCAVLAALSCVDHVTIFDEDTPAGLLRATQPDLYVKGGDYRVDTLPETPIVRAYGGEVRVLSYLEDRSTSAMIERIRDRVSAPGVLSALSD